MIKTYEEFINEEINASEAYTNEGSLNTLIGRKRDIALLELTDSELKKVLSENEGLSYLDVCSNPLIKEKYLTRLTSNGFSHKLALEYANTSRILYWNNKDGSYKANKLWSIMQEKGGFVFGDNPRQEILIGKLLGYNASSIKEFVLKSFKK